MLKIIVASKNPVKIQAVKMGYQSLFPKISYTISGVSVPSGVRDQPLSSEETLQGARNRAAHAKRMDLKADLWVGIEGGIEEHGHGMTAFAWVYILSQQNSGKARTASFFLPPEVVRLIKEGKELGEADDIVFGDTNSKQKSGAVGLLTGDVVDRSGLYAHAVVLALIPFKNTDLYFS